MDFNAWFDIKNTNHLGAYFWYIRNNQRWPIGFIPKDVDFRCDWQTVLHSDIVADYLNIQLGTYNF